MGKEKQQQFIKDHPEELDAILTDYSDYLMKNGYMDSDWYTEEPNTVIDFLNLPVKEKSKCTCGCEGDMESHKIDVDNKLGLENDLKF